MIDDEEVTSFKQKEIYNVTISSIEFYVRRVST